jgi:hypothetical protein
MSFLRQFWGRLTEAPDDDEAVALGVAVAGDCCPVSL